MNQATLKVENRLHKDESFRKIAEKLEKDLTKQGKKKYFITIVCPCYPDLNPFLDTYIFVSI